MSERKLITIACGNTYYVRGTRYGAPDVLQIREIEKPEPEDDEVLIRVHAAEATKADCEPRSFNFAGEVETVGKDVVKFRRVLKIVSSVCVRSQKG